MTDRPDEIVAAWAARMDAGETAAEIGISEGVTRNAVIGAVGRYKRRQRRRKPAPEPSRQSDTAKCSEARASAAAIAPEFFDIAEAQRRLVQSRTGELADGTSVPEQPVDEFGLA